MALTRSFLKALGIDDEKIGEIITAHSETVTALKTERDKYKTDAEKLPSVQEQLDKANADLQSADSEGYKKKYEDEKAAHDKLKTDTAAEKARAAKESALREALKTAGYSETGIKKIVKYGGLTDTVELDDGGRIKNGDALLKSVGEEWSEYKGETKSAAASVAQPPAVETEKKVSTQAVEAAKIFAELHAAQYGATPQPTKEG